MYRIWLPVCTFMVAVLLSASEAGEKKKDDGYVKIFDGKSLEGWHVSAKSGHSGKSGNKSGGKWVVVDGAITGTQDEPGNGGLILTDKKYKNFEVVLEMKNDFGLDSGLFMRSTEDGKAYQAMIDYYEGGNLMGIYGEGLGAFHYRNFSFLKTPDMITADIKGKDKGPTPLPVSPEKWAGFLEARRMEPNSRPASPATRPRSPPGSRGSSSWNGPTRKSASPTTAPSLCRFTAALPSASSARRCAIAISA